MKEGTRRNVFVDVFRYFLSFLVVCVHFGSGGLLPLARLAVPTFFVLAGFYNRSGDKQGQQRKNKSFVKNSFKYLVIGIGICAMVDFVKMLWFGTPFVDFLSSLLPRRFPYEFVVMNQPVTSGFHLWYLVALFVFSVFHYFVCKYNLDKYYPVASVIALTVSLVLGNYLHVFVDYFLPNEYLRNSWFMTFPLFAIGYVVAGQRRKIYVKNKSYALICIGVATFFVLLAFAEAYIYQAEFYLCNVLSAVFFVVAMDELGKLYPNAAEGRLGKVVYDVLGKNATFYIYVFHLSLGHFACSFTTQNWLLTLCSYFGSLSLYMICRILYLRIKKCGIPEETDKATANAV